MDTGGRCVVRNNSPRGPRGAELAITYRPQGGSFPRVWIHCSARFFWLVHLHMQHLSFVFCFSFFFAGGGGAEINILKILVLVFGFWFFYRSSSALHCRSST